MVLLRGGGRAEGVVIQHVHISNPLINGHPIL